MGDTGLMLWFLLKSFVAGMALYVVIAMLVGGTGDRP
jgi:hypothetical protein